MQLNSVLNCSIWGTEINFAYTQPQYDPKVDFHSHYQDQDFIFPFMVFYNFYFKADHIDRRCTV